MNPRVLIVDDDKQIRYIVSRILESDGMEILEAENGKTALEIIKNNKLDLIILDVMLGDTTGFEIIKELRRENNNTTIMVLSGQDEEYDTIFGLGIGADYYITKPFSPSVLGAKVKAILRRNSITTNITSKVLVQGPFKYDYQKLRLYKSDIEIHLSTKEMLLMCMFMENPDIVFTKEMLYRSIWNDIPIDDNTIMVYIRNIRSKIETYPKRPEYLKTVWGIGYRFTIEK